MALRDLLNPYFYGVLLRNYLYDKGIKKSKKVGVPVISIGNLSVGGTGKTPMVRFLVESLYKNYKIAVISRGYKRKTKGLKLVYSDGKVKLTLEEAGDEPYLLAKCFQRKGIRNAIIIVDEVRFRGAKFAVENFGVNLIILDDGFQHRAMARDLDIVLLKKRDLKDALLPFGRLREPLKNLQRADAIVLSYQDVYPFEVSIRSKPVFKMYRTNWGVYDYSWKKIDIKELLRKEFIVFSGLGDNEQFLLSVKRLGIKIKKFLKFPDHYSYKNASFDKEEFYLTTLKDWVKLGFRQKNIYFLDFDLKVERFKEWVIRQLKNYTCQA